MPLSLGVTKVNIPQRNTSSSFYVVFVLATTPSEKEMRLRNHAHLLFHAHRTHLAKVMKRSTQQPYNGRARLQSRRASPPYTPPVKQTHAVFYPKPRSHWKRKRELFCFRTIPDWEAISGFVERATAITQGCEQDV